MIYGSLIHRAFLTFNEYFGDATSDVRILREGNSQKTPMGVLAAHLRL